MNNENAGALGPLEASYHSERRAEPVKLDPDDIEEIARLVAQLLRAAGPPAIKGRYVDATTLAEHLGVERDWVYAHARELDAVRLGGARGRLRFDLDHVLQSLHEVEPQRRRPNRRAGPSRNRRVVDAVDLIRYDA